MEELIQTIPIDQLDPPKYLLRPVLRESVDYLELRDSIEIDGVINSILVRPRPANTFGRPYEIVDGFWRYTCLKDLERDSVPCIVKTLTDEEVIALQLKANAIRPETTQFSFAKHIRRIQEIHPEITLVDLAQLVGKRPKWIKQQLDLLLIRPQYQAAIERGEMSLANAYQFCRLPHVLQDKHFNDAKIMSRPEFEALTQQLIRDVMVAVRNDALQTQFLEETPTDPVPYLRPLKQVLQEYNEMKVAQETIATKSISSPSDAWKAALKWALSLNEEAIQKRREKVARARKSQNLKYLKRTEKEKDLL